MPDKVHVNREQKLIQVQSYGVVTRDDIAESIASIREIFDSEGINKVLVDTTGQEKMPNTIDTFELFAAFPRAFRLALLIQQSQVTERDIAFAETVGFNRGVQVKIFHDKEPALRWLDIR
jgi:hypothetical protein